MRLLTLFSPHLTSTYNGNVLQPLSCDTRAEAQDVTTGDDNLDTLLITHLRLCKGLLQVQSSLGFSRALLSLLILITGGFDVFCLLYNSREIQKGSCGCMTAVYSHRAWHTKLCCLFSASGFCCSSEQFLCAQSRLQMHTPGLGNV